MFAGLKRWFPTAGTGDPVRRDAVLPASPLPDLAKQAFRDGHAYYQAREFEQAAISFKRAIEYKHDFAEAHFYLGMSHRKRDELEEAADSLLVATAFKADFADAWYQLAVVDLARARNAEARRSFDKAIEIDADHADAHAASAKMDEAEERFDAAIVHWKQVTSARPDDALAYCNLGRLTLRVSIDDELAMRYVMRALELQPQLAEAHSCRAQLLQFQGRCHEAIEECDIALQIDPAAFHTQMIRALALLSAGRFAQGWGDYEERKRVYPIYAVRKFPYAQWDGGALDGQRILVACEQGLGDEIMFASCLPDLLARGVDCVFECSDKLQPLFARSFPAACVIAADQTSADMSYLRAVPACDCMISAGSLPRYFRRDIESFPRSGGGYLVADPALIAAWHSRLIQLPPGLRVGLSWRGGVSHTNQAARSVDLSALLPLLNTPSCQFISLQYGDCAGELEQLYACSGKRIHRWPEAIDSFEQTAALAAALDVIISVDTTVAHLSGALGRSTWVLLPANAEWRYLAQGTSMPWYSDMRLFRRSRGQDWGPVVEQLRMALPQRAA